MQEVRSRRDLGRLAASAGFLPGAESTRMNAGSTGSDVLVQNQGLQAANGYLPLMNHPIDSGGKWADEMLDTEYVFVW